MTIPPAPAFRLGLPAWAFPGWKGIYFRRSAAPLAEYARVFNSVEGNTTFYRVPDSTTVAKWREAVAGTDFRFCFKLPRQVTHDRRPDSELLSDFLTAIEPLEDHLGPLLLQFPARIGPGESDRIEAVLKRLPSDRTHALEVRHRDFFERPETLAPLLRRYRLARISLDARALHRGDPDHPDVRNARHEKPDLPVLDAVWNRLRFVRLVLHPSGRGNRSVLEYWAERTAVDFDSARESYLMIHCPNNQHCPRFAREFHRLLEHRTPLQPLPGWPTGYREP